MKQTQVVLLALATLTLVVSACSRTASTTEMPVVDDENCKADRIAKIGDRGTREQFQSLCLRRGDFKPSPKREW
jgi:entry exclusion lipoprotein TrbK